MQTTSFQGISPQFASTKPNTQSTVRQIPSPQPTQSADTVRFGNGDAEKTEKTDKSDDTKKASFLKKSKEGFVQGFKSAIRFRHGGLLQDLGIGTVLAIATAIIPPHAHALLMIPFAFLAGGLWRFSHGFFKGFKDAKAD